MLLDWLRSRVAHLCIQLSGELLTLCAVFVMYERVLLGLRRCGWCQPLAYRQVWLREGEV